MVNFNITHSSHNPQAPLKLTMGTTVWSWWSFLESWRMIGNFSSKKTGFCILIYLEVHWGASIETDHWFNPKGLKKNHWHYRSNLVNVSFLKIFFSLTGSRPLRKSVWGHCLTTEIKDVDLSHHTWQRI